MENKTIKPFGLWPSPVSPVMMGQRVRLDNPQYDSDGQTLVWLEGRSDRGVLVAHPAGEGNLDLTDEHSVRAQVGYGGGDFSVAQSMVIFAERGSGRLFRRGLGYDRPRPITPPNGSAASPVLSPDGNWVAYVWSDGKSDLIALVDSEGREWPLKLAHGADFYMQPAWHPSGMMLAWIEWNHPNMPWDGTHLKLGRLAGTPPHCEDEIEIVCSPECSVQQPQFSPDGNWLSFIIESGEWDDLVVHNLASGEQFTLVHGDGFHLSLPAWVQGTRYHGWNSTSQQIYYLRYAGGQASLWVVDLATRQSVQLDTAPYTWLTQLSVSPTAEEVVFCASAPSVPARIVRWNEKGLRIEARSGSETLSPDFLATPQDITFISGGTAVHALYYAPTHPAFEGEGLPPAILNVHGGPTSAMALSFNSEAAYYTTRGYAYVELNYRGSTGYGRTYRNLLCERWGEADVEDAANCALDLGARGLADGQRIVIKGGSAGGYTVLNALVHHPGIFKAGVCLFGVSNLFNLAMDTHKFEERYLDSMVGPLPAAAARYHAWSPVFHFSSLRDPIAVFQGKEDKVVPPEQAEEIIKALRHNGVAHIYRLYEGEGHGWRKTETIIDYLQQTERFLQQQVLFSQ
jgi:dipeptidyl aminopeptidase/acylaminoacyl peptidase